MKKLTAFLLAMLIAVNTAHAAQTLQVKATGYFPNGYKNRSQAKKEGGKLDRYGNPLRTLQEYEEGSYVSCATDPQIIRSGTLLRIKEFPDILFIACDVGSAVNGRHIDVCVATESDTHELPKRLTVTKEGRIDAHKIKNFDKFKSIGKGVSETWRIAYSYFIQELERRNSMAKNIAGNDMVRSIRISSAGTISDEGVRFRPAGVSGFCIQRYYQN